MLATVTASFTVVGLDTSVPKFFWKGLQLTEVQKFVANIEADGTRNVKIHVLNTSTFDAAYTEMRAAGINIKKAGV